jgi:hypothetical protein
VRQRESLQTTRFARVFLCRFFRAAGQTVSASMLQ